MASIIKIGERWRAQIRRKGSKPITKTFPTKAAAWAWARGIESDIDAGRSVAAPSATTVAAMIERYAELREESGREVLDTSNEHYMLEHLKDGLGEKIAGSLTTDDLVKWCQLRKREGAGPATINMEISKLGTVLRHVGAIMQLRLPDILGEARPTLAHLQLVGGGGKRVRRPTSDELAALFKWFGAQTSSPIMQRMEDILRVTLIVGFRRGEIFRVRWDDVDESAKAVLIRDRKHPRQKVGNDQWVPLIGEAWEVVQRQPRTSDRIFPYHPQTVSKYFKEGCDALGIVDLHFHDMRREASSALIEAGWDPFSVRQVTGHGIARENRQLGTYVAPNVVQLHERPVPAGKVKKTS